MGHDHEPPLSLSHTLEVLKLRGHLYSLILLSTLSLLFVFCFDKVWQAYNKHNFAGLLGKTSVVCGTGESAQWDRGRSGYDWVMPAFKGR